MEVILLQHVDELGRRGEVVRVAAGFARNYLLPRGMAVLATPGARRSVEQESRQFVARDNQAKSEAEAAAARLAGLEVTLPVKADEDGKLYGSVTAADVHRGLAALGAELDRKQIALDQHLKVLGTFEVSVKLHPDVRGVVKVNVVRE